MRRRLRVRGLRPRLLLVVAAGATVTLALLTLAFNVVLDARLDNDVDALLRARVAAQLQTLDTSGGRLQTAEAPDAGSADTPIWVFAGKRALERPSAPAADERAAASLAGGPRRTLEVRSTDRRLYAVPVITGGRRLGTLVSGASLAAYERSAHTALVASVVFAALVLASIILAAHWAIGAALRPVAEMTAAAERSTGSDGHGPFSKGEPYDEVTRLAATFDSILARLAASLRRERTFTAEVSHELRTPLTKLAAEAELALRRERTPDEYRRALAAIHRAAGGMTATLDTLLAAARAETGGMRSVSDARDAAAAAARSCDGDARARGIDIELDLPPGAVPVGAEAAAVERVLIPLVENGYRYAASTVVVAVRRVDGEVRLTVGDDGPGVDPALRDRLFEPGARESGNGGHDGAGLGLALSRRLAQALDGDVDYLGAERGATFRVHLPSV